MTISTTIASAQYNGNGSTAIFPVPFYFLTDTDIKVTRKTAAGDVSVLTLNSGYSVSDAGNPQGGSITTIPALPLGDRIFIERNVSAVQETAYPENGYFPATSHEKALDRLTMIAQQLQTADGYTLRRDPLSGAYDAGGNRVSNVADAVDGTDAPNLAQTQALVAGAAGGITPTDIALKSQLAASSGSSTIGFTQPGTGAAAQTLQAKVRQYISLADYVGWDGTGVADSSTAFSNAVADAIATGVRRVRIPAGITRIASEVTIALTGISGIALEGEGKSLSKILVDTATGDGIEITRGAGNWWLDVGGGANQNPIRIAHMSVLAKGLNIGTGIKISGGSTVGRPPAPIEFDNVQVRAYTDINTQAFLIGVHLYNCGGATFTRCSFLVGGTSNLIPTAVKLECDTVGMDFSGIQFTDCGFTYGDCNVVVGDRIEGLYFSDCAFVGSNTAVKWVAASESGFQFTGCHCNTNNENLILTGVYDYCIQGNLFYSPTGISKACIAHSGGGRASITGNTFYGRGTTPIGVSVANVATGGQAGVTIEGNQFTNFDRGVSIASTANSVTVGTNGYSNVTSPVVNSSTGSFVAARTYVATTTKSLTGGATSETVDFAIPAGILSAKPINAIMQVTDPLGTDMIGFYAYGDANSTATNARFRVVKRDGTNLPAGSYRFGFTVFGG